MKRTYLNKGTLISDPDYPEDGVAMIMEIRPYRTNLRAKHDIYRVHSFHSGHGLWLHKEYVESCKIIYSTGKTCY